MQLRNYYVLHIDWHSTRSISNAQRSIETKKIQSTRKYAPRMSAYPGKCSDNQPIAHASANPVENNARSRREYNQARPSSPAAVSCWTDCLTNAPTGKTRSTPPPSPRLLFSYSNTFRKTQATEQQQQPCHASRVYVLAHSVGLQEHSDSVCRLNICRRGHAGPLLVAAARE